MGIFRNLAGAVIAAAFVAGACAPTIAQQTDAASEAADVAAGASAYDRDGAHAVSTRLDAWTDEARARTIPVKIYQPDGAGPFPVVIFSHGLGGNREGATYLGERLASWGFLAIHIQHPGSDSEVWAGMRTRRAIMGALREAVRDPQTAVQRFQDMPFVLDEIERRAASGELPADPEHIGVYGHSFGAHSVLAVAGRIYRTPQGDITAVDDRIDAGMALSPPEPGANTDPADIPYIYSAIDIPLLHMTGTEDGNPVMQRSDPAERLIPFQNIAGAPQYLVVFDGGDHGVFSGRESRFRPTPEWYPDVQQDVMEAATAFFLAYLTGDDEARAFMDGAGFIAAFDPLAEVDRRNLSAP